nr:MULTISPECIES: SpaH/EbpB family LPXTG-anchored major pilin [unclassified Ruminococcus]
MPEGPYTLNITKYARPTPSDGSYYNWYDPDQFIGNTSGLYGTTDDDPGAYNSDYTPLKGVTFTMVKVADIGNTKTIAQAEEIYNAAADDQKISGTTNDDGKVTLTTNVAGLYYVKETDKPVYVDTESAPFLVYLPMTDQGRNPGGTSGYGNSDSWLTNVYVYPKNLTTLGAAKLTKTINNKNIADITDADKVTQYPEFTLYDVTTTTPTTSGDVKDYTGVPVVGVAPIQKGYQNGLKTNTDSRYDTVVMAQEDGTIAVDGLPVGKYVFVETKAAIVNGETLTLAPEQPFEIVKGVTTTLSTDQSTEYGIPFGTWNWDGMQANPEYAGFDVTIDNSAKPTITKIVDKVTAEIGETVKWTITPTVPADISTYKEYKITDTLPAELTYKSAKILVNNAEYTGVTPTVAGQVITVDFKNNIADLYDAATGALKSVAVEIETDINQNAVANVDIVNTAKIDYTNQYDVAGSDEGTAKTVTGGYSIIKRAENSTDGTVMQDVEFVLKDNAGNNMAVTPETDKPGYYKLAITADAGAAVTDADATVKTNEEGKVFIAGLRQGSSYQLVETKTQTGYQLLTSPIDFVVSSTTYSTDGDFTVVNIKQPDLPLTGGIGTIIFTVAGLILIGGSVLMFVESKRSKKKNA